MVARSALYAALVVLAIAGPARSALVLEYIQVASLNAGPATGAAVTTLPPVAVGDTVFLQVALRDTTGATLAWNLNGSDPGPGGPGSLALFAFGVRFVGTPGVAVNPAPVGPANVALVDPVNFALVTNGSNPPISTNVYGLYAPGPVPGVLPDPANQNRVALFNLRVQAIGLGTANLQLRDPNPSPSVVDNGVVLDWGTPGPTTLSIDDLIFGPSFSNSFDLTFTVPEPSAMAMAGLVGVAAAWKARRRNR